MTVEKNIILEEDHVGRCADCGAEIAGRKEPTPWIVDVERLPDCTPVALMNKAHSCFLRGMRMAAEEKIAVISDSPKELLSEKTSNLWIKRFELLVLRPLDLCLIIAAVISLFHRDWTLGLFLFL